MNQVASSKRARSSSPISLNSQPSDQPTSSSSAQHTLVAPILVPAPKRAKVDVATNDLSFLTAGRERRMHDAATKYWEEKERKEEAKEIKRAEKAAAKAAKKEEKAAKKEERRARKERKRAERKEARKEKAEAEGSEDNSGNDTETDLEREKKGRDRSRSRGRIKDGKRKAG